MSSSSPNGPWQEPAPAVVDLTKSPAQPPPDAVAPVPPADAWPAQAVQPGQPVRAVQPAPGWYVEPGKPGVLRYWNGAGWEEWRKPLVEAPSVTQGQKSVAVAYLLAVFVGGLGIHNFYLGRVGAGVGMLVLWVLGVATAGFFVGGFLLLAVGIWLIVDLCLIPSYVRGSALRAVHARR